MSVQDSENDGWQKKGPVQSGVPRHWGSVRCGCIEGVLATAILAGQHPDVWDAAGLLLREHHKYDHFGQSTVTGKRYPGHEAGLPGSVKQVCQKHGLQCWQPLYRSSVLFLEVLQPLRDLTQNLWVS